MKQYLELMRNILENGNVRDDRTGVGTHSIFGTSMRFDLSKGFPLVTTKKMAINAVIGEALWFMRGSQDRRVLQEITKGEFKEDAFDIWKGNCLDVAEKNPNRFNGYNVGNMYSVMWRRKPINPHGRIQIKRVKSQYASTDHVYFVVDHAPNNKTEERLFQLWQYIRYFHPTSPVCDRWKSLKAFIDDAYCLWGVQEWVDGECIIDDYTLSCDYLGGDILAPDTTIFLPAHRNPSSLVYDGFDNAEYVYRPKIWEDQLQNVVDQIKNNPNDRRIILDAWNVQGTHNAVLGVCHPFVQFYVQDEKLNCLFFMRSSDNLLGTPFNVASYALITECLAQITGNGVGELIYMGGDTHLYNNHIEQANLQLTREPFPLPQLKMPVLTSLDDLDKLKPSDFEILGYESHEAIKAPMAV